MKRATISAVCYFFDIFISIHALVKRATNRRALQKSTKFNFNPRPREEGDSERKGRGNRLWNFNPRPREEGDRADICRLHTLSDFNPRPREEGDSVDGLLSASRGISIHALVKRATYVGGRCPLEPIISIHALVKRATEVKCKCCKYHSISIHALVKRATQGQRVRQLRRSYFNPRPREEGDAKAVTLKTQKSAFQSTPS